MSTPGSATRSERIGRSSRGSPGLLKAKRASALRVACLLVLAAVSPAVVHAGSSPSPSHDLEVRVAVYDLGEVTIEQHGLEDTRFFEMPIPLRGVLALPVDAGPFPVVVFVHGNYPFCVAPLLGDKPDPYPCPVEHDLRQFEGFEDLAVGLAVRGYLTIVPDMSPEYTNGFGSIGFGDRAVQIVDTHLAALASGDGMPLDVNGKADPERIVIAGHSRGGPLAVRYLPDEGATYDPVALALVTPAYIESTPGAVVPRTMPTGLVVATCDGDLGASQPRHYLRKQLGADRPALTAVYTVVGGTHNAISTKLAPDRAAVCTVDQVIDPADQRAREITFLADFFDMALVLG